MEYGVRLLGLLLLRSSTVRSYRVGHAKHSCKYFENDAAVQYPEKIPDRCGEQRNQSLHWRLLERQHDPGNPCDKPHEQMQRVQKFQHPRSGVQAEGKIHQAFQHSFGFGHPCLLMTRSVSAEAVRPLSPAAAAASAPRFTLMLMMEFAPFGFITKRTKSVAWPPNWNPMFAPSSANRAGALHRPVKCSPVRHVIAPRPKSPPMPIANLRTDGITITHSALLSRSFG